MRKLWKCGLARRVAASMIAMGAIAVAMPIAVQADEPSSGWLAEAYEREASVDDDSEAVGETEASQQGIAADDIDVTAGDLAEIYAEFAAFQPRGGERGRGDRDGGRGREERDQRGGSRGPQRSRDRDNDRRGNDRHDGPRRGGPPQWHTGGGPGRAQGRGYRGGPPAMTFNRSGSRSFGPHGFGPGFGSGFGAGGPQGHGDINARLARIERKLDLLIAQSRGRGPGQARGGRPGGGRPGGDRPAVGGGAPRGGFEGALGILGGGGGPRPEARGPGRDGERGSERRGGGPGGPGGRGPEGRDREGRGPGGPGTPGGGGFGGPGGPGVGGGFGSGFGGGGFGPPAGGGFGRPGGEAGNRGRGDDNENRGGGRDRGGDERRPRGDDGPRGGNRASGARGDRTT